MIYLYFVNKNNTKYYLVYCGHRPGQDNTIMMFFHLLLSNCGTIQFWTFSNQPKQFSMRFPRLLLLQVNFIMWINRYINDESILNHAWYLYFVNIRKYFLVFCGYRPSQVNTITMLYLYFFYQLVKLTWQLIKKKLWSR